MALCSLNTVPLPCQPVQESRMCPAINQHLCLIAPWQVAVASIKRHMRCTCSCCMGSGAYICHCAAALQLQLLVNSPQSCPRPALSLWWPHGRQHTAPGTCHPAGVVHRQGAVSGLPARSCHWNSLSSFCVDYIRHSLVAMLVALLCVTACWPVLKIV